MMRRALSLFQMLKLVRHLPGLAKLCWRLFRDPRVPIRAKLLLVVAGLYVLMPADLLPDIIPVVGGMDDITVLVIAGRWFFTLCPEEVVREHVRLIGEENSTS